MLNFLYIPNFRMIFGDWGCNRACNFTSIERLNTSILYLCVAASVWLVYPQVILDFKFPLLLAAIAQLTLFATSLIKFGKTPSFHTYTAKIWGLTLLIATVGLFGFNYPNTLWLAIGLCVINSLEEIVMTLILPEWQCDVLSVIAKIELLRKSILALQQQEKTDRV